MKNGKPRLLFVNSLPKSGIGDFGVSLYSAIDSKQIHKSLIDTEGSWHKLISNWIKIVRFKGTILVNLGFTSYGRSPAINFINFLFAFFSARVFGKKLQLILHDSPDIVSREVVGYKNFDILKIGGSIATFLFRSLHVHVFSVSLYAVLMEKYKFKHVHFHHFPCLIVPRNDNTSDNKSVTVISIGYLAAYKGLEIISHIKEILPDIELIVSGTMHPVLSNTQKGMNYLVDLISAMKSTGIDVRNFISEEELTNLVHDKRVIGILPYKATSGSSYASTFLFERGIPVITSDLPEFRALYDNGAGMILCDRDPSEFAKAILLLKSDKKLYCDMVEKNVNYCRENSMRGFIDNLLLIRRN